MKEESFGNTQDKRLLTEKELLEAFDGDFGEVHFDHKPTADEIFCIKLKLVAEAQLSKAAPLILKEAEETFAKEKAEFGLSVHEAAWAQARKETLKEVGEWLEKHAVYWRDEKGEPKTPFLQAGEFKILVESLKAGKFPQGKPFGKTQGKPEKG